MTNIEPDDFRLLGQKILGRTIGVIFLGQWNESQVYEAFEKHMILIPKNYAVRVRHYRVRKTIAIGIGHALIIGKKHPLDNSLIECGIDDDRSFQVTIAMFLSPAQIKRKTDEEKNRIATNQNRSNEPGKSAHGKGNAPGSKDPARQEPDLPF